MYFPPVGSIHFAMEIKTQCFPVPYQWYQTWNTKTLAVVVYKEKILLTKTCFEKK